MEIFDRLDAAFVARDLHRLRREITEQTDAIIRSAGIDIPSQCTSTVLALRHASKSASELAEHLGYSHQLITQRINALLSLGLIEKRPAEKDARKRIAQLTAAGTRQTDQLASVLPQIDRAIRQLFDEIGVPLGDACRAALKSIETYPLALRIGTTTAKE